MRTTDSEKTTQSPGLFMGFVALSGFDITIDGDGSYAFVTLLSRRIGTFRVKVPFQLMARFKRSIDLVVDQMLFRQGANLDGGEDAIELIKATAPLAKRDGCEITIDGDQVVVLYQFEEGPPIAVRLMIADANELVGEYGDRKAAVLH